MLHADFRSNRARHFREAAARCLMSFCSFHIRTRERSSMLLSATLRIVVTLAAVGRTAGGSDDDDAHWPRRIGLRACDPRCSRKRDNARSHLQELTAWNFHRSSHQWRLWKKAAVTADMSLRL
jgi:hypothetical protein